jgi:hypothetical protein
VFGVVLASESNENGILSWSAAMDAWGRLGTPGHAWGRLGMSVDAWGRLGTPGDACSSTVLDGGQLMEIINPENGGFPVLRSYCKSSIFWALLGETTGRPSRGAWKIETGTLKKCTTLVFRRRFGEWIYWKSHPSRVLALFWRVKLLKTLCFTVFC